MTVGDDDRNGDDDNLRAFQDEDNDANDNGLSASHDEDDKDLRAFQDEDDDNLSAFQDEDDADLREIPSQHLLAASALSDKGSFADQHPSIYFAHHHHPHHRHHHHRRRHQLRHHYHRRRCYDSHVSELIFGQVSTSIIQFNTTKNYRLGCSGPLFTKICHWDPILMIICLFYMSAKDKNF